MYLSIYLPIYLSIYPSIHLSIYPSIHLSIYPSTYLSIYLSIYRFVCLSIFLPVYLQAWKPSYSASLFHFSKLTTSKTQQFCVTSSFFEVYNSKNEAILRHFFIFWTGQHQKRSKSASLPHFCSWQHKKRSNSVRRLHFLNWTTSKTKQFWETSSILKFDNIKTMNSARLPSKMESWVQSWRPRANVFCDFSSPPV